MIRAFLPVLCFISSFGLKAQDLFNLQFHYESINSGPYVHLDKGDSLKMYIDHKIGTADLYFIKYTMRNELEAEKILFVKEFSGDDTLVFVPMAQGCYQLKVVPGARLRYFHAGFDVNLSTTNSLSGRSCTVSLDSGYMEIGNEKYLSGQELENRAGFKNVSSMKKQIHSNGVPYVESRFELSSGEKAIIDLKVASDNPKANIWIYREGEYYNTDIFRTFQSEQTVGFKALKQGKYVVQFWGRGIFDRMEELKILKGR